ncbi:fumarylacetoacetate hydrolase family protein [Polymorphobacter sp. PAMC 29334]|uniref:fumarylacetoacetate hydrolase family protein n=1 Tax=Polymorphobacter sp. PAMC 29334 TaxID=2862331 RepID=UPI001C66F3F6|nr:fumarylacetoacetate hydrolase family protein [Polymorphobacter sp. PAMC 29334]QYE35852.1 fumarylacetoacetate hydrolase family protein [Polymorphobacter sp. PAMC 29334]
MDLGITADALPSDWQAARLLGRIATAVGPVPILIADGIVYDMTAAAPTVSMLVEQRVLDETLGTKLGTFEALHAGLDLLSPIDLHCVKAAGVTFAVSALERVIEESARGDPGAAAAVRSRLEGIIGVGLQQVVPGSPEAATLKDRLIADGMWSQYLEVAIGPDAEVFTKAQILSTVGWGAEIGIRSDSTWNNPEPEIVMIADSSGHAVGATLGNDVNLRDFEGRSALLLGKAKDNNASCSIGPFIRLFDDAFSLDDVRRAEVNLLIEGTDGYTLTATSSMSQISRDPTNLLKQTMSEHQYPDGFALFLGTMFAPTKDRDEPGRGFTHKVGDRVSISTPMLGRLVNRVTTSNLAPPWTFGISQLLQNLAGRGLLSGSGH